MEYQTRSGATIEAPRLSKQAARPKRLIVPLVDRAGNFISTIVNTGLDHPGQVLVRHVDGKSFLSSHAEDTGHVLYEDMCKGRVPGVAASTVHWAIYRKVSAIIASGRRMPRGFDPSQLYHPEVRRRAAVHSGGQSRAPLDEMRALVEQIRAHGDDFDEAQAQANADERKMNTSDGRSLEQLLEEAHDA